MPFFTIYSNKAAAKHFIHAKNHTHAFQIFRTLTLCDDEDANIEDGFDFERVWNAYHRRWVGNDSCPELVEVTNMRVNGLLIPQSQLLRIVNSLTQRYDLGFNIRLQGAFVQAKVEDLSRIWLEFVTKYPEDLPEEERDAQDLNKRYQAHDLSGLIAVLQKQLDSGRGAWKVKRSTDPVRLDSEGIQVSVGSGTIWINDYEAT